MSLDERRRRFAIGDVLILIAGLAAGLALVRATNPGFSPAQLRDAFLAPRGGWTPWYALAFTVELGAILAIPFVAGWTPACLLLQLTGPRPPWRHLRRRPGFVACLIATVVVLATTAVGMSLFAASIWELEGLPESTLKANLLGGVLAGGGVFWSWTAMRLCRACRPAPTWADRLGRLTGAVWVALGAISVCFLALALN